MSTFTFTALLEEDLLQGVNGSSIGYGDTFVMPDGATVEMIVTDDDNRLSGDYYSNENGDDYSGQTADININGEQVFDDAKIYAESYHVLQGSDGYYYYMIEIELAGSEDAPGEGDDFFTFWGWTPPEGVSLTVVGTYNVTCDWIDFGCLDGGELIQIEPENSAPIAVDDALETDEVSAISANLLDNDSDPDNDPITVTAIEGGDIGSAFEVTTAKGNKGMVTVQADGSFTFDPVDGFKTLAQDEQDSFELTYTISDDPQASAKHNLMFVLDISNSTIGAGGGNNIFDGTGVGDVNNDGLSNTVLDAEIAAVIAAVNDLVAQGVDPANIDIGIATFSGVAAGFATVDAETLGTFALDDSNLMDTLMGIQSGGWTNYEAGLQQAESWFAGQAGDGAQNKLIFLSDGRPISGYDYSTGQYITQTEADYGDEVSRIANDYGAEIYGIGVGANSDLDYLNDLDNTGGAERVLDADTLNVVVSNAVAQPASATATVTVTINGLNDGPDAVNDALTVDEDEVGSINILDNDSDIDGDAISILNIAGNKPGDSFEVTTASGRTGTVTVQDDGTLTFDPGQGFLDLSDAQSDSFTVDYTITDGQKGPELLINGDFESHGTLTRGDVASGNSWDVFDSIDGWYTPVGLLEIQQGTHGGTPTNSITNSILELDSHDSDDTNASVVQDVTVAEGGLFEFSFDYSPRQLGSQIGETSVVNVWVNGEIIATLSSDTLGYESQSLIVELDAGANTVGFSGGGTDDTYGALIDNVSLKGLSTDTATVTVLVNGKGQPVDAKDDAFSINEDQGIMDNVLGNDIPNDGSLKVVGVSDGAPTASAFSGAAAVAVSDTPVVGSEFTVTTDGGRSGTVTLAEDGTFTFDGGTNFIELAEGETDSFDLTYTVEGAAKAGDVPKHNVLFVIDISGSTSPAAFGGSAVGDQNGDGVENSVLDAEIAAYKALSQKIAESGLTDDKVDIGLIVFSGNNGSDQTGASELLGTFKPGSADLDAALGALTDGGFTNFEAPLQTGIGWFEDQAATTDDNNIVYFLSDGMQNVGGTFDDEAAELATRFGAELNAVGVGSGAVLDQLNLIDNTDGAEIVTTSDALTAALVDQAPELPGDQDTATITVTINGQNEAPTPANDILVAVEGTGGEVNILANDTDPDGDDLTLVSAGGKPIGETFTVSNSNQRSGTVTVDADGKATFTPDASFDSLDEGEVDTVTFTYEVSDGQFTREATVTVEVTGRNAAPTPADDPLSTNEGEAKTINILGNDTDPDGDTLTIVDVHGVAVGEEFEVTTVEGYKGTVKVLSNGDLTFTPSSDFDVLNDGQSAMVSFDYTVSDGQFESDATVTVLVNGVSPANGKVTVSGTISASVSGSTHVAVVFDTSVFGRIFGDALESQNYDSDALVGTISDYMMGQILDLANTLNDSDTISVISSDVDFSVGPEGQDDAIVIRESAAVFKEAAADPAKAIALFSAFVPTYKDFDYNIDLPEGLNKAAAEFADVGATNNEVVVLAVTDTVDQSGAVMARQTLVDDYNADINVVYIEAGLFADTANLNAIDTEGGVSMDNIANFGSGVALETLVDDAPSTLGTVEAFSILLDGAKVAGIDAGDLVANEADGTYTFTATEIELDGMGGELEIKALIDTDNDAATPAEEFVYLGNANTDLGVMDGDTIDFILG